MRTGEATPRNHSILLAPTSSPPLCLTLTSSRFDRARKLLEEPRAASSYFSPSNKIPTTFGPIYDFASRTHNVSQAYIRTCPPIHMRYHTTNSHPLAASERCSAAKCYLTNHLADPWSETPSSRGL